MLHCYTQLLTKVGVVTPVTAPAASTSLVATAATTTTTASLVAAALTTVPAAATTTTTSLEARPRGATVLVSGTAVPVPVVLALVASPEHVVDVQGYHRGVIMNITGGEAGQSNVEDEG